MMSSIIDHYFNDYKEKYNIVFNELNERFKILIEKYPIKHDKDKSFRNIIMKYKRSYNFNNDLIFPTKYIFKHDEDNKKYLKICMHSGGLVDKLHITEEQKIIPIKDVISFIPDIIETAKEYFDDEKIACVIIYKSNKSFDFYFKKISDDKNFHIFHILFEITKMAQNQYFKHWTNME